MDISTEIDALVERAVRVVDYEHIRLEKITVIKTKLKAAVMADSDQIITGAMDMWRSDPLGKYKSTKSYPDWYAAKISNVLREKIKNEKVAICFEETGGHYRVSLHLIM